MGRTPVLNDDIDRAARVFATLPTNETITLGLWADVSTATRDGFAEIVDADALDGITPAALYFLTARPRDYTHGPRDMGRVVVDVADVLRVHARDAVTTEKIYEARYLDTARRLVEVAGREHRFCTKPVTGIGLGYESNARGPLLCGGPIHEGRCPSRRAHREVIARHERNARLREADRALSRAADEQHKARQGAHVHALLTALHEQVDALRETLRLLDEASP